MDLTTINWKINMVIDIPLNRKDIDDIKEFQDKRLTIKKIKEALQTQDGEGNSPVNELQRLLESELLRSDNVEVHSVVLADLKINFSDLTGTLAIEYIKKYYSGCSGSDKQLDGYINLPFQIDSTRNNIYVDFFELPEREPDEF